MKPRSHFFPILMAAVSLPSLVRARPIVTRPVDTVGQYAFEAQIGVWQRNDKFRTPDSTYKTVGAPAAARVGLTPNFDVGLNLDSFTHTLETGDNNVSGSLNGVISPEIKYKPLKDLSFLAIWHVKEPEISTEGMPIARGDDFELIALTRLPTAWPITFNGGYLYRNPYRSNLGVQGGAKEKIEPGNIWEARGALEIPLFVRVHIAGIVELAYYYTTTKFIDNTEIPNSAGQAADALVGLNWGYGAWNIGGGVAFGLLDERHTSFDIERGAGDVTGRLTVSYRLQAKKAGS